MGYTGEIAHTPQCLDELILAHLAAIPFENLDACEDHLVPSLDVDMFYLRRSSGISGAAGALN